MKKIEKWVRPFRPFDSDYPFHFYLTQFVVFAYAFYRLLSRDYAVYGLLSEERFDWSRKVLIELWPGPASYFTTFQFLYDVFPRPGVEFLGGLEVLATLAAFCGLIGAAPRIMAWIVFLITLNLTGLMQASNSEFDGGTLMLVTLFILGLAPGSAYYRIGSPLNLANKRTYYRWPVFLVYYFVGVYYFYAGINKILDVGLTWPFTLHLERLAVSVIDNSLFTSYRFVDPLVASMNTNYPLSVLSGFIVLLGELGILLGLLVPILRLPSAASMTVMHILVFLMTGINFLGNSFFVFLCLDWNRVFAQIFRFEKKAHKK